MHVIPKTVSHAFVYCKFSNIWDHISMNVVPFALIPKISLTCDVRIIKATADVNPDETGPETKSIKNPRPNIPINNSIKPHKKHNRTDFCHEPFAVWYVSKALIALGPTGTSLQLPNNI